MRLANVITRIEYGILLALFWILPLVFTARSDELFEFPKILLLYSAAGILASTIVVRSILSRQIAWIRSIFDLPLGIFLVSQIISTLVSIEPHTSLFGYYSRFNGGLFSIISYILVFQVVLRHAKHRFYPLLFSILFGATTAALYAFPEHFGFSPSCLLITGEFTVSCWVQDVQTRVFGTLGQPNWLAAVLVATLPFVVSQIGVYLLEARQQQVRRLPPILTLVGIFFLFCSVILFTKSRSGILATGVILAGMTGAMIIQSCRTARPTKTRLWRILPGLGALLLFFILLLLINNPVGDRLRALGPQGTEQPQNTPTTSGTQLENGGSESGDIRKVVWSGAVAVWRRYPLFGSGVETFAYSYFLDRPAAHNLLSEWDYLYNKAHNEFLNYFATTGSVGGIAYLLLIISFTALPLIWWWRDRESQDSQYFLAVGASSIGIAITNFFGFSTVVVSLLTFSLPALVAGLRRQKRLEVYKQPTFFSYGLIGMTIVALGFLLLTILMMWTADLRFARGKAEVSGGTVQDGLLLLQDAVLLAPEEPTFRDEYAYTAARLAYAYAQAGEATAAARLAEEAIDQSTIVLQQNPVHINFHKTRIRITSILSEITPEFQEETIAALKTARELSPTDPKLPYNLGVLYRSMGKPDDAAAALMEAILLRPIDQSALLELADLEVERGNRDEAKKLYERVLQLSPSSKEIQEKIASLSATQKK